VASHEGTPPRTASTSWFPTVIAGSSDPSGGQCGGCYPDEPGLDAPSSSNHYPDPGWDSPSVTAVSDEEEEVPDGPSDGVLGKDCTDDALSLENVSRPEDSPPNPTLVSAHGTDASPEVFEDLLDPALLSRTQESALCECGDQVRVVGLVSRDPVTSAASWWV
jgi:hypothetical protein